jgi:hypothetical protein
VSYALMSGILTDAAQRSDHIRVDAMRIERITLSRNTDKVCILRWFAVI